jgi:hypothetical protein
MTTIRFTILGTLALIGFGATANAQFAPGFGYGRTYQSGGTTITPYSISQQQYTATPWLQQVTYNQTYLNAWTGVTYQRQYFSNPYGTWSTVRAYDPYAGPALDYRYANTGPIDVYSRFGPYRPGFVIRR